MAKPNIKMPLNWALKDSNGNFGIFEVFMLLLNLFGVSAVSVTVENLDSLLDFSRKRMLHTKIGGFRRFVVIYIKIKGPELISMLP
jgi:hypothetical protein